MMTLTRGTQLPKCGAKSSKRDSAMTCELPPGHVCGEVIYDFHYGRDRRGSWRTWEGVKAMSLREYPDLIQGTDEWLEARRGMVTASVTGQLVTPSTLKPAANVESRGLAALLVAERITGHVDPTFVGDDMVRGWHDEPHALEVYGKHFAPVDTIGFLVRDDWGFEIGCSPDGIVAEEGLIEFKSRRPKKHLQTILAGQVPAENMAQIQCGLLVSGRAWCDYVSYCGGMPLWVCRVEPDPRWQTAIVGAVEAFEAAAAEMTAAYHRSVVGLPQTERVVEQEIML